MCRPDRGVQWMASSGSRTPKPFKDSLNQYHTRSQGVIQYVLNPTRCCLNFPNEWSASPELHVRTAKTHIENSPYPSEESFTDHPDISHSTATHHFLARARSRPSSSFIQHVTLFLFDSHPRLDHGTKAVSTAGLQSAQAEPASWETCKA